MGWASGMQAGTAMARNWIDTYRSADEARRIKKVMDDTQREIHAFDKDTTARIAADQAAGKSLQATVGADGVPVYHSFPAQATPAQQQFVQGVVDPLPRTQSGQGLAPLSGPAPQQRGVVGPAPAEMIDSFIERGNAGLAREPLFPQGRSQRPIPRTTNGEGLAPAAPPTADESVSYRAKPQWTYGGRTYDAPLSEEALRLEQQRRIGLEMQRYNPEAGLRVQNDAARAMREAELHPLTVQAKKQSIESTGYTLRGQQRDEESILRVDAFEKAMASRPELSEMSVAQVAEIARKEYGLKDKEINAQIEQRKGFAEGSIAVAQKEMELRTRDMPLPKLLEFQRKYVADGVHFTSTTDAKGRVTLQMRDDADPNKIIETLPPFDNAAYAEQYLRGYAKDPDVAVGYIEAQQQRIREAEKAHDERLNSASQRNLEAAQAGYYRRMPPERSSSSASLYGSYKKGDRGTVIVTENGRMVYKNGVFDGKSWGDGKRPFEGTAIPASMLDLKTIKQQAAKHAEQLADTPKQQLADGRVQKWTYDEAYRNEEQRLIQLEVGRFANGIPLEGGEGGLPFGWEGGGAPAGAPAGSGGGGGLYRPAALPQRKQDVEAREKRQAQAAAVQRQAQQQQREFYLSREAERRSRLTPAQRKAEDEANGVQAVQVGAPLRL